MTVITNRHLMIKVCQMYYLAEMSQKEISEKLGISRPQICRIISAAKEKKIVSITIEDEFAMETEIEQALIKRYGLKDAVIFDLSMCPDSAQLDYFGAKGAEYIESILGDKGRIGVMSGSTISAIAAHISPIPKRKLEIIPLMGGLGSDNVTIHANAIAQKFAENCGGNSYSLNAPVIVRNSELKEALMREPTIQSVLKLGTECDLALFGIGNVSNLSTTAIAGQWTLMDRQELEEKGIIASVCNSFINHHGQTINTSITERSIGQSLTTIQKAKKIGAAYGTVKVDAIHATLQSGNIDVLITDIETAKRLLKKERKKEI